MAKIVASNNPELQLEMEAMDKNTPAHYSQWNERHQQLLNNDACLADEIEARGLVVVDGCLCAEYESED